MMAIPWWYFWDSAFVCDTIHRHRTRHLVLAAVRWALSSVSLKSIITNDNQWTLTRWRYINYYLAGNKIRLSENHTPTVVGLLAITYETVFDKSHSCHNKTSENKECQKGFIPKEALHSWSLKLGPGVKHVQPLEQLMHPVNSKAKPSHFMLIECRQWCASECFIILY